jgi:hypothetical protein
VIDQFLEQPPAAGISHGRSPAPSKLEELLRLPPEELNRCDIARMNLLCAEGLIGSEDLDVDQCLAMLDDWCEHIQQATEQCMPRWRVRPNGLTEGQARIWVLTTQLKGHFGIRYPVEETRADLSLDTHLNHYDSRHWFIHGLLGPQRIGTCNSIPVLVVTAGRRLGYPLYLMQAKRHLFCRWEGDGERFNIEATGPESYEINKDDVCIKSPQPLEPEDIAGGFYLRSLTPAEELAQMLASRGHSLRRFVTTSCSRALCREARRCADVAGVVVRMDNSVSRRFN